MHYLLASDDNSTTTGRENSSIKTRLWPSQAKVLSTKGTDAIPESGRHSASFGRIVLVPLPFSQCTNLKCQNSHRRVRNVVAQERVVLLDGLDRVVLLHTYV